MTSKLGEAGGEAVKDCLANLRVTTFFIELASPWENDSIGSFVGELRDELLNGEIFSTLKEA